MSFRDFYAVLLAALSALWTGKPVGSHEILAWLLEHEPVYIDRLRAAGYLDHDDENRTGWSWRQYLANALVRLAKEGRVRLVGHTDITPKGYYGPVGLWEPVGDIKKKPDLKLASYRLPAEKVEKISNAARQMGVSSQSLVDDLLDPGLGVALDIERDPERWMGLLERDVSAALADASQTPPIRDQKNLMLFSFALSLRVAERLDPGSEPWTVCAQRATFDRLDVLDEPASAVARIPNDHRWMYEEGNDITYFFQRRGRSWPLLSVESEAANWGQVEPGDWNDYAWDFYKLFSSKAAASLLVSRVAGKRDQPNVRGRIERLAETLECDVYQKYRHLLWPGQPVLIVLMPGSQIDDMLLGTAVNPSVLDWRWTSVDYDE